MHERPFLIAEIAQAHDGSLGILHSYIDALAHTGIDAIKFQTHLADYESSPHEQFRVNFSYVDSTRYDYWKRMEFSFEQWLEIKRHCDDVGVEFMSSPFSNRAAELLERLGVKRHKIASGELSNYLLLEYLIKIKKPVILSTGLVEDAELEEAYKFLNKHISDITILQCTTMYPTPPEKIFLNRIIELKNRFNCNVGLSDHSGSIYPGLAACALGAKVLEFHAVFDKRMFGPDSKASLEINEISQLVTGVKFITKALISDDDTGALTAQKKNLKQLFGKSLSVNKSLPKGHLITFEDLEAKKPAGYGIDTKDYSYVIGRSTKRDMKQHEFLNYEDLEQK